MIEARSPTVCRVKPGEPGKAGDVIQSESKGLRIEGPNNGVSLSLKVQEPRALMSEGRKRMDIPAQAKSTFAFCTFFILFGSSVDWMMPTSIGEDSLCPVS